MHNVSGYFERSFASVLFQHSSFPGEGATAQGLREGLYFAIADSLLQIESSMLPKMECAYSGTTACIAVVLRGVVHFANVGDSRAVVASQGEKGLSCSSCTVDHKPEQRIERARIIAAGGMVRKSLKDGGAGEPYRVYQRGSNAPGLAMSRSLGDVVAHSVGVTAVPDFTKHVLRPQDTHVILGSDGMFDALTRSEISSALCECQDIKAAVEKLAEMSDALYMRVGEEPDDTTVCGASVKFAERAAAAAPRIAMVHGEAAGYSPQEGGLPSPGMLGARYPSCSGRRTGSCRGRLPRRRASSG